MHTGFYYTSFKHDSLTCYVRPLIDFLTDASVPTEQENTGFVPLFYANGISTIDGNVALFEIRGLTREQEEGVNRYLTALLLAQDADIGWEPSDPSPTEEDEVHESPIRFSLMQCNFGGAGTLHETRYLLVEVRYDFVTQEEAERQINLLMRFLSAPGNVARLTTHDRRHN